MERGLPRWSHSQESSLDLGLEARELVGAGVSVFIQAKGWPVALPTCPWIKDLVCAPFDSQSGLI